MEPSSIHLRDNLCLMVINPIGKIRLLHVPFRVKVIGTASHLVRNSWVYVEEIRPDQRFLLEYRIMGIWWPYHLFLIRVSF